MSSRNSFTTSAAEHFRGNPGVALSSGNRTNVLGSGAGEGGLAGRRMVEESAVQRLAKVQRGPCISYMRGPWLHLPASAAMRRKESWNEFLKPLAVNA